MNENHDRQREFREFREDLERVRRALDDPFLGSVDGNEILRLMVRLSELIEKHHGIPAQSRLLAP